MVLNWRSLNSWKTVTWKYINKCTQYRFLPLQSNWSFFAKKLSTKKERHFFIFFLWNKCVIRYVLSYCFFHFSLVVVLFGPATFIGHTALKIDRFLDLLDSSYSHHYYITLHCCIWNVLHKMYFFPCYIQYYYFLRRRIWSPLAFKGDPKVCSPSSVWQISRVSPVLLPKTNRIVLCQRRGGRYEI